MVIMRSRTQSQTMKGTRLGDNWETACNTWGLSLNGHGTGPRIVIKIVIRVPSKRPPFWEQTFWPTATSLRRSRRFNLNNNLISWPLLDGEGGLMMAGLSCFAVSFLVKARHIFPPDLSWHPGVSLQFLSFLAESIRGSGRFCCGLNKFSCLPRCSHKVFM